MAATLLATSAVVALGSEEETKPTSSSSTRVERASVLALKLRGRPAVELAVARYAPDGVVDVTLLRAEIRGRLPRRYTVVAGRRRVTYDVEREATVQRARVAGVGGGEISVPVEAVAATVRAPVLRQALRNNCESAAIAILSSAVGRPVGQITVQRAFPRSGTVDPVGVGADRVWGDPTLGYVGRAEGGGVAGGFGVFEGPVRRTAARFGLRLDDLSRRQPGAVYDRLRRGGVVMAWIGLSDGPYGEWTSPAGRRVRVNFGEHTVVLHGIREDGSVLVSNPLEGTRERWTPAEFEAKWELLDRRALATRPAGA